MTSRAIGRTGCHRFVAPALGAALLSLVLAGCTASTLDSAAAVSVSGRLLRADGTPAAGVTVGLERAPDLGDLLVGTALVPLTLFTACLADPPPEVCRGRSVRRVATTPDGTYTFTLRGKDTQTFFGGAGTLSVSAEVPPRPGERAGAAVTAGFKVQTRDLRLHDLRLWEPQVTVGAGRIGWDALTGTARYQVGVEDARGQPVWSFDGARPDVTFDPRILEDTAGSVAVSVREPTTAEGTTVTVVRRSARVAYRGTAGAPTSRGRPCTRGATQVSPCLLTDGDLASRLVPPPAAAAADTTTVPVPATVPVESATIDLGRTTTVSLVVVRGCQCQVDGSADGRTWTGLGQSSGSTAVVPARTAAARYVRVTGSLADLREVSVWDSGNAPGR